MRSDSETNSINRVLKARGMPTLDQSGVVAALAYQVEDHQHFMELLRACDPALRRDMYEAMRPHLRFPAKTLSYYEAKAAEYAEAAALPVMDEQGFLHEHSPGTIVTGTLVAVPQVQLWVKCAKCGKEVVFLGSYKGEAIFFMRKSGWAFDESPEQTHLCAECLDTLPVMD